MDKWGFSGSSDIEQGRTLNREESVVSQDGGDVCMASEQTRASDVCHDGGLVAC